MPIGFGFSMIARSSSVGGDNGSNSLNVRVKDKNIYKIELGEDTKTFHYSVTISEDSRNEKGLRVTTPHLSAADRFINYDSDNPNGQLFDLPNPEQGGPFVTTQERGRFLIAGGQVNSDEKSRHLARFDHTYKNEIVVPWGPNNYQTRYAGKGIVYSKTPTGAWTKEYEATGPYDGTTSRYFLRGGMAGTGDIVFHSHNDGVPRAIARNGTSWSSSNTYLGTPADWYATTVGEPAFASNSHSFSIADLTHDGTVLLQSSSNESYYRFFVPGTSKATSKWVAITPQLTFEDLYASNPDVPIDSETVGAHTARYQDPSTGYALHGNDIYGQSLQHRGGEAYRPGHGVYYPVYNISGNGRYLMASVARPRTQAYNSIRYRRLSNQTYPVGTILHV